MADVNRFLNNEGFFYIFEKKKIKKQTGLHKIVSLPAPVIPGFLRLENNPNDFFSFFKMFRKEDFNG